MSGSSENPEAALEVCLRSVEELGSRRGIAVQRLPGASDQNLRLELNRSGMTWTVDVDCTWPRYSSLPTIRLVAPLELLAHVSYNGTVCINDAQGLSVDLDRQSDVVAYAVELAIDLLERSRADASGDRVEFYREFEGYWSGLPDALAARSSFEIDGRDRLTTGFVETLGKSHYWYFGERNGKAPKEFNLSKAERFRALYVAMPGTLSPPAPGQALDANYVKQVVATFTADQKKLWNELLGPTMNSRKRVALLVAVPRGEEGRSVVGMTFHAYKRAIDEKGAVRPLVLRRQTVTHMRARGGASAAVASKHVVVFGCGAVGSEVADALASSGVGHLTLVDPDLLSEDNVFRHVLGPKWISSLKTEGLMVELESRYPGLRVQPSGKSALAWLKQADLSGVDGFVLALGAPTAERVIMRSLHATKRDVPAVITWLEPLDLGGHAVGIALQGEGCLDCLYRDEDGAASLSPRTAFLEPGQQVSRNLTGCGGAFVPYGALQSRQTALIAATLLLDGLAGAQLPAYSFWAGSGGAATAEGLRTTSWWRFAKTTSEANATRMVFGRPCSRCRSTR